jgi:hypothetical protein
MRTAWRVDEERDDVLFPHCESATYCSVLSSLEKISRANLLEIGITA